MPVGFFYIICDFSLSFIYCFEALICSALSSGFLQLHLIYTVSSVMSEQLLLNQQEYFSGQHTFKQDNNSVKTLDSDLAAQSTQNHTWITLDFARPSLNYHLLSSPASQTLGSRTRPYWREETVPGQVLPANSVDLQMPLQNLVCLNTTRTKTKPFSFLVALLCTFHPAFTALSWRNIKTLFSFLQFCLLLP